MSDHFYQVSAIYPAMQGETNIAGIGAPVIFLRLAGCHLRCYKSTFGQLCDTPEALEGTSGKRMDLLTVLREVLNVSHQMGGTKLICLTGGDPLWRKKEDLQALFLCLGNHGFTISVETSGTLSIAPYVHFPDVHWVLDYKLKSAGVKQKFIFSDLPLLNEKDFIKFVALDHEDYAELKEVLPRLNTKVQISVGTYWNGKLGIMELFDMLKADKLLGRVTMNVQLHKLAFLYDTVGREQLTGLSIPQEI